MIAEHLATELEPEFRLSRDEIHNWAQAVLVSNRGDVIDSDAMSREAISLIRQLKEYEGRPAVDSNYIIVDMLKSVDLGIMELEVRKRILEGLAELSEGLDFYRDVQAVVADEGGGDRVIDLRGVTLLSDNGYGIGIVDGQGSVYDYEKFKALLTPRREDEE